MPGTHLAELGHIATHILAFEGDSRVTFFDGAVRRVGGRHDAGCRTNDQGRGAWVGGPAMQWTALFRCSRYFSEYEDWRKQTLGDAATRPHRITYRKLTR